MIAHVDFVPTRLVRPVFDIVFSHGRRRKSYLETYANWRACVKWKKKSAGDQDHRFPISLLLYSLCSCKELALSGSLRVRQRKLSEVLHLPSAPGSCHLRVYPVVSWRRILACYSLLHEKCLLPVVEFCGRVSVMRCSLDKKMLV